MKKKLFLTATFLLLLFSFNSYSQAIGKVENGQAVLTANQTELLQKWNAILENKSQIKADLTSLSIQQIDDKYYLVAQGEEYKSTLLLNAQSNGTLQAGKITCTTKSCAHNDGCIPQGDHCTACTGDCSKSTSIDSFFDSY